MINEKKILLIELIFTCLYAPCMQCMIDNGVHDDVTAYVRGQGQDMCAKNPGNCEDGLSFSIWEKFNYDPNVMINFQDSPDNFPKKYIVSSGAEFDYTTAKACPGFAIFRQVCRLKFRINLLKC